MNRRWMPLVALAAGVVVLLLVGLVIGIGSTRQARTAAIPSPTTSTPAAATFAGPGTTLVVHLVDAAGRPLTSVDASVVVSLSAGRSNGAPFERYASAKPTGCYKHRCLPGRVGTVSGGVATFTNLPPHLVYVADADAGHAFDSLPYGHLAIPRDRSKSINLALTRGASIAGRVTLPDTGKPAAGISVAAIDPAGHVVHRGVSRGDGSYRIVGLASGSYRIKFNTPRFGDVVGNVAYVWTFLDRRIVVRAETPHSAATVSRNVDGALVVGHTLTILNRVDKSTRKNVERVVYVRGGTSNNVDADFTAAGVAKVRVPNGDYYLQILIYDERSDNDTMYWYAGDGKPVVRHRADAVPVRVAGTRPQTVALGDSGP